MKKEILLDYLNKFVDNEEQRAVEDWYFRNCPSGDVDSVQNQWLSSYDREDFLDEYGVVFELINKLEKRYST